MRQFAAKLSQAGLDGPEYGKNNNKYKFNDFQYFSVYLIPSINLDNGRNSQ